MHFALVLKSAEVTRLSIYDEQLTLLESDSFPDLYALNFHIQTLSKKLNISKALLIVHDLDKNNVGLALAQDEESFFVN